MDQAKVRGSREQRATEAVAAGRGKGGNRPPRPPRLPRPPTLSKSTRSLLLAALTLTSLPPPLREDKDESSNFYRNETIYAPKKPT